VIVLSLHIFVKLVVLMSLILLPLTIGFLLVWVVKWISVVLTLLGVLVTILRLLVETLSSGRL